MNEVINLISNMIINAGADINDDENPDTVTHPIYLETNGFYPESFRSMRDFRRRYPKPIDRFFYYIRVGDPYTAHQYIERVRHNIDRQVADIIFRYVTEIPSRELINPDRLYGWIIDGLGNRQPADEIVLLYTVAYNLPDIFIRLAHTVYADNSFYYSVYNLILLKIRKNEAPIEIIRYLQDHGLFPYELYYENPSESQY